MLKIVAVMAVSLVLFPPPCYAYIDPGSGSYILQILVAGLLGFLYSIKLFWTKMRASFTRWRLSSKFSRFLKW